MLTRILKKITKKSNQSPADVSRRVLLDQALQNTGNKSNEEGLTFKIGMDIIRDMQYYYIKDEKLFSETEIQEFKKRDSEAGAHFNGKIYKDKLESAFTHALHEKSIAEEIVQHIVENANQGGFVAAGESATKDYLVSHQLYVKTYKKEDQDNFSPSPEESETEEETYVAHSAHDDQEKIDEDDLLPTVKRIFVPISPTKVIYIEQVPIYMSSSANIPMKSEGNPYAVRYQLDPDAGKLIAINIVTSSIETNSKGEVTQKLIEDEMILVTKKLTDPKYTKPLDKEGVKIVVFNRPLDEVRPQIQKRLDSKVSVWEKSASNKFLIGLGAVTLILAAIFIHPIVGLAGAIMVAFKAIVGIKVVAGSVGIGAVAGGAAYYNKHKSSYHLLNGTLRFDRAANKTAENDATHAPDKKRTKRNNFFARNLSALRVRSMLGARKRTRNDITNLHPAPKTDSPLSQARKNRPSK